jgi:ferredoxin
MESRMKITFTCTDQPDLVVEGNVGETLLTVMQRNNIPITTGCCGAGICGSCQVRLSDIGKVEPPQDVEDSVLEALDALPDVRLACQVLLSADSEGLKIERNVHSIV